MNYEQLSKEISYALRHAPWEYELEMDLDGSVLISQLLSAINEENKYSQEVAKADLEYIIKTSEKKHHEISGDKIRALYGHSIPMKIEKSIGNPPDILYHGTAKRFLDSILQNGLQPMNRQYVHLSVDTETATQVGKRRDNQPIILKIDTKLAFLSGIAFYIGNEKVWLADSIPPQFISVMNK